MAELCPSENPGDRKILVTKLLATYGTITAFEGAMLWLILVTVTFRLSPGCYPVTRLLPVVAVTFLLGFVVERTDSLLLAVTLHEWLDIAVDSGGTYLMWAALACIPLWLWLN
jgi:hypothetical protein